MSANYMGRVIYPKDETTLQTKTCVVCNETFLERAYRTKMYSGCCSWKCHNKRRYAKDKGVKWWATYVPIVKEKRTICDHCWDTLDRVGRYCNKCLIEMREQRQNEKALQVKTSHHIR